MSDDATILRFPGHDDSLSTIDRITPGATSSALSAIRRLYNESLTANARTATMFPPPFADALTAGTADFRLGLATAVAALLSEVATLVACRSVTVDVDAARDYLENGTRAQDVIRAAMDRDPDPTPAWG